MDHSCWVQENCRVCGGRLGRYKVSYDCHTPSNQGKLQAIGVSVKGDREGIHPQRMCQGCYNVCTRTVSANNAGKVYTPILTKFEWVEHSEDDNCTVCQLFGKRTRGRKPKKALAGRPPSHLLDLVTSIKEKAPPSLSLDLDVREKLSYHPSTDEDLKCPLCHLVLDCPMNLTTCNRLVCLACCIGYLYQHTDLSCPCCGTEHLVDSSTIIPASTVIQRLLQGLKLQCEKCQYPVLAGTVPDTVNNNIL